MQIHNKDLTFLCIYLLFGVADLGSFGLDSDLGVWILIRILLGPDPTWIRIQICNTAVTGNKESVLTHCLPLHALHIFSCSLFLKNFYITLSSTNLTLQPMVYGQLGRGKMQAYGYILKGQCPEKNAKILYSTEIICPLFSIPFIFFYFIILLQEYPFKPIIRAVII